MENKTSYCKLCGTKISLPWLYKKSLFSISSDDINIQDLSLLIDYKIGIDSKENCEKCMSKYKLIETSVISYVIEKLPLFLFFILDLEYEVCKNKRKEIRNLFISNLTIKNETYDLISIIFMPSNNHYTIYFKCKEDLILKNSSNSIKLFYHDGLSNNGRIITLDNFDSLFQLFNPYIVIYIKKN